MNYVVFDLEWNQSPYGKTHEIARLPFEIIEIGAVKLNEKREVLDTFQVIVRPAVYKRLNYHTREIVHLSQRDLDRGTWFPDAVRQFLSWSGPDSVFCTWGTVDLQELQRNMKYYNLLHLLRGPLHFYDAQKLFAIQYEDMKSRRALEYAVDFLNISKTREFHRALADAAYTADVFRTIDPDIMLAYDSIDVYQNPRKKTEEIHLVYNGYSKFISREFKSKEEAMEDPEVLATPCCLCGRSSRKKIRWFSVNARNYYCVAVCPVHGVEKGKIRMKHNDEGDLYVVKTIKVTNEPEIESLRMKRDSLRARRRRRRSQ
ncbi:MAG: exonuclease domain-containing protein [Eubacterium sp.]|nr:exonuclease domain-containing protein [Eubacterium sp.]